MSSRVQKGNTVFRPVAKARSRPPPPNLTPAPFDSSHVSETAHPIPSTAVPGREAHNQVPFSHQGPVPIGFQSVIRDSPLHTRGISTLPTASTTSDLSSAINTALQVPNRASVVAFPPQETGHPVIVPHPLQITSATSPTPAGPSSLIISAPLQTAASGNIAQASTSSSSWHTSHRSQEGEKSKRKRKLPTTNSDGEAEEGSSYKRPKSRSITPRQRRSCGPSLPPYDSNADPGEDIDPTTVTMATLCSDTGQGRVSSKAAEILNNHAAWKIKNRERRARMRTAMEAKKYGRPIDEDSDRPENAVNTLSDAENRSSNVACSSAAPTIMGGEDENEFDYTQQMEASRYNVQVRIGPSGETVIDEDSLVVDRTEAEDMSSYTHVVESDHTKFVNSGTYGKRYRGSRWSAEETELFYHALSQYGENYELIAYVLPGRDRKSCKNKFKAEDKKNHARINACLNNRIPVDMKTLERMTGKDFSGPVPEIRAPPPPPPPIVQRERPEENTGSQAAPAKQVKKRNRSRDAGLEDGVIIVGEVDSVLS